MKAEVSIQVLKFCFQVLNCILLVSGTLSGDDHGTEREADDDLSPVPPSVSVPICPPPGSGCQRSLMFSVDPVQLRKPLECSTFR